MYIGIVAYGNGSCYECKFLRSDNTVPMLCDLERGLPFGAPSACRCLIPHAQHHLDVLGLVAFAEVLDVVRLALIFGICNQVTPSLTVFVADWAFVCIEGSL